MQTVLVLLYINSQKPSSAVYIAEEDKNVILTSVFNYGSLDEYKLKKLRPLDIPGLADGVYLVTATEAPKKGEEEAAKVEITSNCLLIKDTVGYKEASYSLGMFDCDTYPVLDDKKDRLEVTPLSKGDLLSELSRGVYELELPPNLVPGYEHPIKCFLISDLEGSMGILNGFSGMACEFGEKTVPPS